MKMISLTSFSATNVVAMKQLESSMGPNSSLTLDVNVVVKVRSHRICGDARCAATRRAAHFV